MMCIVFSMNGNMVSELLCFRVGVSYGYLLIIMVIWFQSCGVLGLWGFRVVG